MHLFSAWGDKLLGHNSFDYALKAENRTFQAPITNYTDPDDEKYYCITHPDMNIGADASELPKLSGRILYINGDNNITDTEGRLMNQRLDAIADDDYIGSVWKNTNFIMELQGLGFIKDCSKALQSQNQTSNNQTNNSQNSNNNNQSSDDTDCEDENRETNDDGCGDCLSGYTEDASGVCVEDEEEEEGYNWMIYGGLVLVATLVLIGG